MLNILNMLVEYASCWILRRRPILHSFTFYDWCWYLSIFYEINYTFCRVIFYYLLPKLCSNHRVIILDRGSMFPFQWKEFSPPLISAHRLLQCYHRQKRDRRRCNSRGIPPQPPATRAISQWARSLEWRHAALHILVGKICISFFLLYCEGMHSLVVLWLCG